jgi:hypothetical protein
MIGGSKSGMGWKFFSSPPRPDRFWGPPSSLSNGYQGLFLWDQSGRVVKLTIHLYLVLRSRMLRAVPLLPQYAFMAWCSVKAQVQVYLYLNRNIRLCQYTSIFVLLTYHVFIVGTKFDSCAEFLFQMVSACMGVELGLSH